MVINKSTHNGYRTDLFMPIMKEAKGKYLAVLSDNSTDRDEEYLSESCVRKLGEDDNYIAALCNHSNDVFMQVAEWTNRGVRQIDNYTALVAEPKFFMSNPNAKIIKGMLDEGAKIGISIGAMVKKYDDVDGKRVFQELELLEASFVAIPSNRHGRAMAVAKSFNAKKTEDKMENEITQKDIDSAIVKNTEEFTKQLESKDLEINKIKKELEDAKEAETKSDEKLKETETKVEESEKKLKETVEALEKSKKDSLEKQNFADQGNSNIADVDINKEFNDGKLPIMRG